MRVAGAIAAILVMVVVAAAAHAGPIETLVETGDVSLAVRADRSTLTTADTLTLRLEASIPDGAQVQWPEIEGALGEFTVIDRLGLPPKRGADGGRRLARVFTLAPFLAGEYEIPPLEVVFELESGETLSLHSQPMQIEVSTLLDEEPGELSVGEMAGPAALPEAPEADLWPLFAGAAGAAIAAAAGAAVMIQRRARRERPAPDPVRSARLGLAAAAERMAAGGEPPAPVEIDDLARPALARLLGARQAGATSAELAEMARRLVPAEALAGVERYLGRADEALFSGREPNSAELLRDASAAVESLLAWRQSLREAAP